MTDEKKKTVTKKKVDVKPKATTTKIATPKVAIEEIMEPEIVVEDIIVLEDVKEAVATVDAEDNGIVTVDTTNESTNTVVIDNMNELTSNTVVIDNMNELTSNTVVVTSTEDMMLSSTLCTQEEATGDTPEEDWPEDVKKEWYTPRVYDENRPVINIGVVCGMKEMTYREVKKQLDIVLWQLPPWKYKHKIHCVMQSSNYFSVKRYAETRKKDFQTCPIYYKNGPRAKIVAFEHLIRQINGGVLLILKDKEDGAITKLMQMAEVYSVKTIVVEY
jgi:hypothetical protein